MVGAIAPRENAGGSIFSVTWGLFGISSGDALSWDQQSLLPPVLDLDPTCCQISYPLNIPLAEFESVRSGCSGFHIVAMGAGSPSLAARRGAPASAAAHRAAPTSHWQQLRRWRHFGQPYAATAGPQAGLRSQSPSTTAALGRPFRIAGP